MNPLPLFIGLLLASPLYAPPPEHPEERALLVAINDFPADDTPRLVYADWLQEHGQDERATFIRLQVERARNHPDSNLSAEELDLIKRHAAAWAPGVPEAQILWQRGFPASVSMNWESLDRRSDDSEKILKAVNALPVIPKLLVTGDYASAHGPRCELLKNLTRVRQLEVQGPGANFLHEILPLMPAVRHLAISKIHFTRADINRFLNCDALWRLQSLTLIDVGTGVLPREFSPFDFRYLQTVEALTIRGGADSLLRLLMYHLPALKELDISEADIFLDDFKMLPHALGGKPIRALHLPGYKRIRSLEVISIDEYRKILGWYPEVTRGSCTLIQKLASELP